MPDSAKGRFLLQVHAEALKVPGASFVMATSCSSTRTSTSPRARARASGSRSSAPPAFSVTAVDKATGKFDSRASLTAPMGRATNTSRATRWSRRRGGGRGSGGQAQGEDRHPGPQGPDPASDEPVADDPRIGRPPHRARSRARLRGELRRHQFLTTDKLGKFEFGANIVNFFADGRRTGGSRPAATTTTASRRRAGTW